jgi:hypothetical protein
MLDILHSFVNIFAGGRSEIKVYLFVLYIIFLGVIYFSFQKKISIYLKWKWFGITLLITYFYGLILHIFYVLSNNLSLTDFIITGNNGEISSSVLWHTHLAKGFIGQIFSFLGKTNLQTMDAGGAYINLIPSPLLLLGSILLITIIIQAVFYFITSFRIFLKDKNARQKIFLSLGYILITFSLIKASIDGGIFNPSFGISITFVILFVLQTKEKISVKYNAIYFVSVVLLLVSLYIDSTTLVSSGLLISSIATLISLYNLVLYGSEKKIYMKFIIPLIIIFISGWWVTSIRDREIYDYSVILLNKGQQVYIYNKENKNIETLEITKEQTVAELSKQLNRNITYMPITIPGITCMPKSSNKNFFVTLTSLNPIFKNTFIPSSFIGIKNENSVVKGKNWETKLLVSVNQCIPEILSVINGELLKNNINTYILVNPTHYDTFNN